MRLPEEERKFFARLREQSAWENRPVNIETKKLCPHQLGWLRRKELDHAGIEVWELPNGRLHPHDPKRGPLMLNYIHWAKCQ